MQLTRPSVIEEPVRHIASPAGVSRSTTPRARSHGTVPASTKIMSPTATGSHNISDSMLPSFTAAAIDSSVVPSLQPQRNRRTRLRFQHIPALRLAAMQPDRLRLRVIRMDLHRQLRLRKQHLHQQRKLRQHTRRKQLIRKTPLPHRPSVRPASGPRLDHALRPPSAKPHPPAPEFPSPHTTASDLVLPHTPLTEKRLQPKRHRCCPLSPLHSHSCPKFIVPHSDRRRITSSNKNRHPERSHSQPHRE